MGPSVGLVFSRKGSHISTFFFQNLPAISLPEVIQAVEEDDFVVQKYGAVVRFRHAD